MKEPDLPWTPILIVLAGTAAATWLIFKRNWMMWEAYLLMAGVAAGVAILLLSAILWLRPPSEWSGIGAVVRKTIQDDWKGFLRILGRG